GNSFKDADKGDSLSYRAESEDGEPLPDWLHFDAETLTFSGTAGNEAVGSYRVRIIATDAAGLSAFTTMDIIVENVNDAPIVVQPLADQTMSKGMPFAFTVPEETFIDVDAVDVLSYSAALPDGAPLPDWL